MVLRAVLTTAVLVAGSAAQFAQFSSDGYSLAVNVPSDTASSGNGSIYLQIGAPSGTQWISFGQGTGMAGSNMFVVYAADSSNVTVSPRLGTGHVEPDVNPDASIFVLEGTGITSDGIMVANIRCDTCLSWNGGSMDPTSTSSDWIYAHKSGDVLDTTSIDAEISLHDGTGQFTLDLTQGTGGSSSNPFVAASDDSSTSATPSATESVTATSTDSVSTPTGGVSNPIASSDPSSSGASQTVRDPNENVRIAHAAIMSLVFVVMFPLAALTVYLPYNNKVRHIHAPLQVLGIMLMITGLGLGVELGKRLDELDGYHMVIGYIVFAWMVVIQPALGLGQHLHFRRVGTRSPMGHSHRWLGRAFLILGVINGGLGFKTAGDIGSDNVPNYSVIIYSVFAAVIFLAYLAVVLFPTVSTERSGSDSLPGEKSRPRTEGYEMHGRSFENPRSNHR
ncbi:uncharacterized protein Z518_08755 [Rhinocladiella mackenziei CBS 650.93]|uniref:DOMON domain-containing protein n=1 Tax=Rhinocladiella mackenziei CBS 650.93 TaxID=1442369 RepID=A0A0D2FLE9_9EURO|nr:uncharacterized protein Z518_08755 [Rhinocladiella mackenziei CBS 650.93]KIX02812.1 hypothetical protein Z518_08755 [Rhinocladiella mackenziei CBS 650.93]